MTPDELMTVKSKINTTLSKRTGVGNVSSYAGSAYNLTKPASGEVLKKEVGEKTVDLLLKITGDAPDRSAYPELGTGTYSGGAVPEAFNVTDMTRICNELDADVTASNRGGFKGTYNGVAYDLPGGNGGTLHGTETTHCGGACTGLCVGSCLGQCNGCTGCSATCGTGCASGAHN